MFYRNRGPVLILLGLFALMPVHSGLSHWYKSEQRNHWFGYWFGHDMFTPPFTDPKTGKLSYDNDLRAQLLKDPVQAKIIYPEMPRNTILFGGTDPGRFCPTYSIFCDSFIPHSCQPEQDQKFDRRDVYLITQNALADGTYLDYLRSQYYRSAQHDPPFFSRFFKYCVAVVGLAGSGNIVTSGGDLGSGDSGNALIEDVANLLDNTLDVSFTKLGANIEKRRRAEGVYPPKEIYIPSPDDSQQSFKDYTDDVARRSAHDANFPNEPRQINRARMSTLTIPHAPGVQVSGQVAVMMINGLLCKVIFEHNPTNEFYVEESFPLDWMYPYETPFGIIMHINRQPLTSLTDDIFQRDHAFWTKYSDRLCGNFITYDTSVKEICDFAEKIYVQNNYEGFQGRSAFHPRRRRAEGVFQIAQLAGRRLLLAHEPRLSAGIRAQKRRRIRGAETRDRLRLQAVLRVLPLQPGSRLSLRQLFAAAHRQPPGRRHSGRQDLPETGSVQRPDQRPGQTA